MTQAELEEYLVALDEVQRVENFGYSFFFVGDDHRMPFVTIANSDNEFDNVSNLNREGVFRVNIGIKKETFKGLITEPASDSIDYSVLNTFLPHPDYAKQYFVCILNPTGSNLELAKQLITEAHSIAARRFRRKTETSE